MDNRSRPLSSEPPEELRFRLDAEAYEELEIYCQLYAQEHGEAIDTAALAAEILGQFLADGRALKTWKRRRANGAHRTPVDDPRQQPVNARPRRAK